MEENINLIIMEMMNIIKNRVVLRLTHAKRFARLRSLGFRKTPVGCALSAGTPFMGFYFTTVVKPCKTLRFSLFGLANRRLA